MMKCRYILLLILQLVLISSCNPKKSMEVNAPNNLKDQSESFTIAFGSCNKQDEPQPLWKNITAEKPDLWIWLGDNIYGDSDKVSVLKAKYEMQNNNESYRKFKSKTPIIGIWDDHDYGINDGDKNFPMKDESKNLALDFLEVSSEAEVRKRPGMHQSFVYDFENLKIRVLLLDGRYFRDPLKKVGKQYQPESETDILGESQWTWLESELAKDEDALIIGCGIQFIPEEHRFEKWANYPTSRSRLFNLLGEEKTKKIILISGDRHIGEISKLSLANKVIYEVTSSGLTHTYRGLNTESNKYRVGELTQKLNYGVIQINQDMGISLELCGVGGDRHLEVDYE